MMGGDIAVAVTGVKTIYDLLKKYCRFYYVHVHIRKKIGIKPGMSALEVLERIF
jgi:uncharacterized protein YunC (DUF1805 family)